MTLTEQVTGEIRAEMGRQRLTTRALSRRLGWTDMALSRRIGRAASVSFTLDELESVAEALGRPVRSLLLPRLDSNQQPAGLGRERRQGRVA